MKSAEAGASGEIYCKLNLGASQAAQGEPVGATALHTHWPQSA